MRKGRPGQAYGARFPAEESVQAGPIGAAKPADRLLDCLLGGVLCVAMEGDP